MERIPKTNKECYALLDEMLSEEDTASIPSPGSVPSESDYSRFHNLNVLAAEICAF